MPKILLFWEIRCYNIFLMTIERYNPKYKDLIRLRLPVFIEKRQKLLKFNRKKWKALKKAYFPRYPDMLTKVCNQDSSSFLSGKVFGHQRSVRKKKAYKFLLLAKQRFQKHFGEDRVKFYQFKSLAALSNKVGRTFNHSSSRVFYSFLENRVSLVFFRIGLVYSLLQAKKLVCTKKIKINKNFVFTWGFSLRKGDLIDIDPIMYSDILNIFLKQNLSVLYFRRKKFRRLYLYARKISSTESWILKKKQLFFNFCFKKVNNF